MNTDRKADFSAVTAQVDTTADVVAKPDFGAVTATVDTTADVVGEQRYTVQPGDSLSKIAKRHYGDGNVWPRIFEANRDVLDDPDRIMPGQHLRLPAA